jgi:sensor histidine kinase YesM
MLNALVNFKNIPAFMQRLFFFLCVFVLSTGNSIAQDTIKLNGQPQWETGLDIANQSLFYEEQPGTSTSFDQPLSFEEIKKQPFIPYAKEYRYQKFTNRPLIIQWFKFIISNTSVTDSIHLRVNVSAHYFTRLYNSDQLIATGGAYQAIKDRDNFWMMPVTIPPLTTITYWARTEDRQNQLIPPSIGLETPYTFTKGVAAGKYTDRYLFLLLASMVGCLFFISLYAMYQYYLYRDKAFLWYISYTIASLCTALFWMDIRHGMNMFPSFFHDMMLSVFLFLVPVLYSFFIGSILKLGVHFKKGWMIVQGLIAIAFLQMLTEFITIRTGWFPFNPDYYGYFLSIAPVAVLHIVLLVLTVKSKEKVKWFLFTGLLSLLLLWCFPVAAIVMIPFHYSEVFVILIFPPAFLVLGLTIEAICFSFALSYRSKLVLVEKNALQQNYNQQLEAALQQRTIALEAQNKLVEAQKIKQVETEFEHKIAETEMIALRAQMNPHFIFNCLNSIKLYTLENDSQTASEYLTKFSQLIRLVLENSRSEKVTLQKELETLTLYIELEAMRFKNKVQYKINVSPAIDQHYIEIPPLLLQPYVENAIWHGLMHKPEGGNILIEVTQPSEYILHIEITDDGVGRTLSALQKSKSATRQKSYGLKMTSERLDAINHIYQTKTAVKIIDLADGTGKATGTKVVIEIPL